MTIQLKKLYTLVASKKQTTKKIKMKTKFLLLASLFLSFTAVGQQSLTNTKGTYKPDAELKSKLAPVVHHNLYNKITDRAVMSRWYGYYESIDSSIGRIGDLNFNMMFPDSTINALYGDGTGGTTAASVWIHKVANILDPKSTVFNNYGFYPDNMEIKPSNAYTLDSVGIWCVYVRNTGASVVDTLLVEVMSNNTAANMTQGYFLNPVAANLSTDTVWMKDLGYDYMTNELNGADVVTIKIPLDEAFYADSVLDGIYYVSMPVTGFAQVNPGKIVSLSYSFIPGYTWVPLVDTVSNFNWFRFFSNEENGLQTYPSYIKRDWNTSYILPTDVRYNYAGGWNGSYIPSYAYMGTNANYSYENHWIDYKLTCDGCALTGIKEVSNSLLASISISPNPVADNGSITLSILNNSKVEIGIFDLSGKYVGNIFSGNVNAGVQEFAFDATSISSGIYFIQVKADNGKIISSTKLVVAR